MIVFDTHRIPFSTLMASLVLASCTSAAPPPVAIGDLNPANLDLPARYERRTETTAPFESVSLSWSIVARAAPTTNNCPPEGKGALWMWANNANAAGVGDPTIRLDICDAGSAARAEQVFRNTPLERTVLPQFDDLFQARQASANELNLAANETKVACVWTSTDNDSCRAWAYLSRFDRYLVTAGFVVAGTPGSLSGDAFRAFIGSLDHFMADELGGY